MYTTTTSDNARYGVSIGEGNFTARTPASALFDEARKRGLKPSEVLQVKRAYTVKEAAEYLGLSVTTIRQLIRDDTLPAKKSGTKVLIDALALDAYFEGLDAA